MKIRTFIITAMSLFVMLICCNCASAQRSTELPVAFCDSYRRNFNLDEVYFSDLELTGAPNYQLKANMNFSIYNYIDGDSANLSTFKIICYDANGTYLNEVSFPYNNGSFFFGTGKYELEVLLPDTTAAVEIASVTSSNTYLFCPYENVYAADGRVLGVPSLQVPVYEAVGWYEGTYMCTEGMERVIKVSPFQVEAYKGVGWYTVEDLVFEQVSRLCKEAKAAKDYNNVIIVAEGYNFKDYNYASQCMKWKTEAMDAWRKSVGSPLAAVSSYISEGQACIKMRNISYKPIVAFQTKFDVYDIFGNYIYTGTDNYIVSQLYMPTLDCYTFYWDITNGEDADHIRNFRVIQVVFEDRTTWSNGEY